MRVSANAGRLCLRFCTVSKVYSPSVRSLRQVRRASILQDPFSGTLHRCTFVCAGATDNVHYAACDGRQIAGLGLGTAISPALRTQHKQTERPGKTSINSWVFVGIGAPWVLGQEQRRGAERAAPTPDHYANSLSHRAPDYGSMLNSQTLVGGANRTLRAPYQVGSRSIAGRA